jgi:hypothetical protein
MLLLFILSIKLVVGISTIKSMKTFADSLRDLLHLHSKSLHMVRRREYGRNILWMDQKHQTSQSWGFMLEDWFTVTVYGTKMSLCTSLVLLFGVLRDVVKGRLVH